jgi:hypothetical protein
MQHSVKVYLPLAMRPAIESRKEVSAFDALRMYNERKASLVA